MLEREYAGIFADPGLGKTAIALSVIACLKIIEPDTKALIISPLRPMMSTWPQEIQQWDCLRHLRGQVLHGKNKAIDLENDVFFVNPEGLKAFFAQKDARKIKVLVVDESSKFKNWSAERVKLLNRYTKKFSRKYIMTGTPAPNGLLNLFAQIFLLDRGKIFGRAFGRFQSTFFESVDVVISRPGKKKKTYKKWTPRDWAPDVINSMIAPFCLRLDGEKLLDLPDFVYRDIRVDIGGKAREQYDRMENDLFCSLDEGETLLAGSSAVAYGLLRQMTGGATYLEKNEADDGRKVVKVHDEKISALEDLVSELGGKPVLIVYNYKHELDRIRERLGRDIPFIGGGVSAAEGDRLVAAWNADELPILCVHPVSVSHGLNMQRGSGRCIVWFSLTDDLEAYLQTNRRIRRQGVSSKVFIYHIIARGTIDEVIISRLGQKEKVQSSMLRALMDYRDQKEAKQ